MLKLVVDKLEDVEEAYRGLYVEKDGKFHLKVEGYEDPAPHRRTAEAARRAEKAMQAKIEKWEKLGKSPEEIEALIAKATDDETKDAERKGEWDKLKQQMNDRHAAELAKLQKTIAEKDEANKTLRQQIENHLIDAQATSAIAENKGVPQLLLPHVRKHVKVEEVDGELKIVVTDGKGGARVNGKGEPLTVAELVADMRSSEIFGRAFEATGSSGGGSPPGSPGGAVPPGKRRADFKSEKERAEFVDKHGLAAYTSLPA